MIGSRRLILASGSPRRKILLHQIGLEFEVIESGVPEDTDVPSDPREHVSVLSRRKATAVAQEVADGLVVGADTIVVLDGQILGKPADARDAGRMLGLLSGRTHTVFTGFTLLDRPSGKTVTAVETTEVTFRPIAPDEIAMYVASGSPMDKAGAYGIQDDYGAVFVRRIEGCFYNVVGFPLSRFHEELTRFLQLL
jgi:septum formation protein